MQPENYNAASELTVLGVCFVMVLLLLVSFKVRTKSFRIFFSTLWMLIGATSADLTLHFLFERNPETPMVLLYALRAVYHILLFCMLHHFVSYACEITSLSPKERRPYTLTAAVLLVISASADIVGIFTGNALLLVDGAIAFEGSTIFIAGYVLFLLLILYLLLRVRHRLYSRVMNGFFSVMALSLAVLAVARIRGQSTFTVSTFLYPLVAIMYLMHSNPYDAELGANDMRGLNKLVHYSDEQGVNYAFLSLYMRELDKNGKAMSDELRTLIRHVAESYYRKSVLFQISSGHMLLMVPKDKNSDFEQRTERMLETFNKEYERFRYDYKVVIGETSRELSRKNEYVSFLRSVYARIPENTVYRVKADDLNKYRQYDALLKEVADIAEKKNLDDPRVLVYAQPVYNIQTGNYDTAEALMRLSLEGHGIIYPDQFIPLAEENGYIHALTLIILNKTCQVLRNLIAEGYDVSRVSVNVSALELRDGNFCGDIYRIIENSGLEGRRIAIELTESRNESDFLLMKERIEELKKRGLTFYLDDFGTGYSNMERILELPFDIIKFDRSMVVAGGQNVRSKQVLGSLADLFSKLKYSVLYEGVENEKDEEMCLNLKASYLQGYKYSKPVPIGELRHFLARKTA